MTRLIAIAAAALFATTAFAGQSDRYHDLRLDTSLTGIIYAQDAGATRPDSRPADLWLETFDQDGRPTPNLSSRSAASSLGEGFAYGGFGPHNDSR
jgi:hypothetical protein